MSYFDRTDAGKKLASALNRFKGKDAVVLALPRGGIVLGAVIARKLEVPLGLILVRKISHPYSPEYAIGAVVEDEEPVFNESESLYADRKWLDTAVASARELINRRRELYYGDDFHPPEVAGKTVIIVDDGIATGLTMTASVKAMRSKHAGRVVVAVPVASSDSVEGLEALADEVIVLDNPNAFMGAVGVHYRHFDQVEDKQVKKILREVSHELQQTAS
ncbi:MAG TPA: phosphoribosyltransferase family protein [Candidatus Saccharimonadales bacterium]|nr:phosphoribosyltransferase family protein [Candidatus Saccharimonadales bacterium]